MRVFVSTVILGLAVGTAHATPLKIAKVTAPDIYCEFDTDCKVSPTTFAGRFILPGTTGDAFVQSLILPPGEPKTPAHGLYAYLYRIDLTKLTGKLGKPCVETFGLPFGPVKPLFYDDDKSLDEVFVISNSSSGTVSPTAAEQLDGTITFSFTPPVCPGPPGAAGKRSLVFGLASANPPAAITAHVQDTLGTSIAVEAQAPVDVNCNGQQSLAAALKQAVPGDTIRVTGRCLETITIPVDDLTLIGIGSTTIQGNGASTPVVTITGRRNVVIKDIIVSNGGDGVVVQGGAHIVLDGIQTILNANNGFRLDEKSTVQCINCTASHNGGSGFLVQNSAVVAFDGQTLSEFNDKSEQSMCLGVFNQARVFFRPFQEEQTAPGTVQTKAQTSDNRQASTAVSRSVSVRRSACAVTLHGCGGHGICASNQSGILVDEDCVVTSTNNNMNGAYITDESSFSLDPNSRITAQNNRRHGLQIVNSSSVLYEARAIVIGNDRHGLLITGGGAGVGGVPSTVTIHHGTVEVTGNGDGVWASGTTLYNGIHVAEASVLHIENNSAVTSINNAKYGLSLTHTAQLHCNGSSSGILDFSPNDKKSYAKQSNTTLNTANCRVIP